MSLVLLIFEESWSVIPYPSQTMKKVFTAFFGGSNRCKPLTLWLEIAYETSFW
jgi:hypothetical protein